ncbi:MAG: T9SS type A sorting domain-containing protein [Lentimicrobiaceae bacterium]|nr:T9SS type A sorting domain-containing protein [Lentimicrobiaceae bacterium]
MKSTLPGIGLITGRFSRLALAIALTLIISSGFAAEQTYSDSWGSQGLSLTRQGSDGLNLNFSIRHFNFAERDINGERMTTIEFSESLLPNDEGAPDLPGLGRFIAIPQGATPVVDIINLRTERFSNIEMAPAPRIPLDTDQSPLFYAKNEAIYTKDAFYPAQPVTLGDFSQIRGVDVCMLGINPYQYNPVTKELIVYRDIEFSIRFEGGNNQYGDERLRSRYWDPILEDAIFNFGALPKIDYDARVARNTRSTGYEYLIIVPNDPIFMQWADSIKKFRTEEGIYTGIVPLSEIGTNVNATMLETYVNTLYSTWDIVPSAILLLGDYGQATANNTSIISPIWDNYCVSDNILADVDNDDMPDIVFARITAQNASQLESMIGRFLKYERNPPTNPSFYDKPITALGWQTERWFQICSEVVGGFWKNGLGKNPVRINEIYDGNPGTIWSTATNTSTVVGFFGPMGLGYIPQTPNELGNWSGGNANMINAALNAGSFMLMHRDHGMETGWGEPYYTNSNINGLTNTDLSFILSINCLTGKYNYGGESFAEKFHRYTYNNQPAGALGLIAASEVSYSFVNDVFVWGLIDNMWPNFMPTYGTTPESRGVLPAFGNAAGKYFLKQSNWPYNTGNKEVTYNLFHHHGDAFLRVCTEVPQNISATYNNTLFEDETVFNIAATPASLVCLTANGVILGTGTTGLNNSINITIPAQTEGTMIKVTITRPNFNRYEGYVSVIPSVTAASAGEDATICEGNTYQLTGQATNYTSLLWETSGTGTFDDASILTPIYTPSTEDVTAGAVVLSLTAFNPELSDSTDYLTLSLRQAPLAFAGTDADICTDQVFHAETATAANYTNLEWITSGTGTFDDNTAVTASYTLSEEDIAAGNVSLTLRAWNDICDPVESMIALTVRQLPEPMISGQDTVCQNIAGVEYTASTENNTYAWEITGGSITEGQNDAIAQVTWDTAGEGNLILTETNEFGCSQSIEYPVLVNEAPAPAVNGSENVCANSQMIVYATTASENNTFEWMANGGEIIAGANTNEITVNWGENGTGSLSVIETDANTSCATEATFNVTISSPVISLGNDTTICLTHELTLSAETGFATYAWSDGSTGSSILINGQDLGTGAFTYMLTVTNGIGCEGTASRVVTVDACAGIDENNSLNGINIYPNPNSGDFTIEILNAAPGKANISISNATGKIVYSGRTELTGTNYTGQLSLGHIASGIYILKVETTDGVTLQKLIIR